MKIKVKQGLKGQRKKISKTIKLQELGPFAKWAQSCSIGILTRSNKIAEVTETIVRPRKYN